MLPDYLGRKKKMEILTFLLIGHTVLKYHGDYLIFDHKKIEEKWQKKWADKTFSKGQKKEDSPKYYSLTMFSYPSGSNLHVGHWYNYGPADTFSRYKQMRGYNVFQPQGFDAFGLPAENYAIKHGIHPAEST